ncbi:MAG: RagB/SusD family nutrient uptake outer membrane protein [Muribaculaceae bacterium]
MKFKYNFLKIMVIAISVGSLSSCEDFLTRDYDGAIDEDKMFKDEKYLESNVQGIFNQMKESFKDEHCWMYLTATDEIQRGALQSKEAMSGCFDKFDANLNSENDRIRNEWNIRWGAITSAAKVISKNEGTVEEGTKRAHLYGEACFIRGYMDFELAMYWGKIPTIDLTRIKELGYGRQPLDVTWKFIIKDFENAAKYCPKANTPGRATTYAANMMLAYAYMAAPESTGLRDFKKAKTVLEENVINGPFSLVPFADLFDYNRPNSAEAIFELQYGNTHPNNNQIQFQIGSRVAQNWWSDGCYYAGYDHIVITDYAYKTVEQGGVWEYGDIRKEESIRYDFTYYGEEPDLDCVSWEGLGEDHDELKPHLKKYEDFRTDQHSGLGINNMWNCGKNIPVLRFANALLLYAECLNETGSTPEAIEIVNRVRTRAWDNNLPTDKRWSSMSKDEFRIKIMDERIRELIGEKWRKIDLVRTGNYVKLVKERNKWTKRAGLIADHNTVWPIPATEIEQNEDMTPEDQNEGYR